MDKKEFVLKAVADKKALIVDVSDKIFDYAEVGFHEFKTAKLYEEVLKKEGFQVEMGVGGMPTAFKAVYGSGKPVIGFLAEYDALPELSQEGGCTMRKKAAGDNPDGHGCGHNLLGAGAMAAALAVKAYIEEHPEAGTVILFGCPSEEKGDGKAIMAREGVFDGVDAAFTWHPGDKNAIWSESTLANVSVFFNFKGVTSHAAAAPELGRSALDAAELMSVGVNYLREHMIDAARIHYAYSDPGGTAPNVVQSHAVIKYEVRAPKVSQVQELFTRVVDVAKGAALMTGTKMKYEITMAFSDYVPNRTLGAVVDQCMRELGAPEWTEPDYRLAAEFLRTYPRTTMVGIREKLGYYFEPEELDAALEKPLDRVIHPFNPKETAYSSGSTDVGDVGYATPTVMFHVATACLGNVGHSWQNTAFACSDIGMKGMLRAAEIMTLAAIRTMDQPAVIAKAREELKQKNGGSYHCPLPDYVTPPIGRY